MTSMRILTLAIAALASPALAQYVPIPLNYNFNGIVHAGESGNPDAPNGFRSISDRALDFSNGVPSDALLNNYTLVGTAGALDLVHLGNRNQVAGGSLAFDPVANNDDRGIQPTWLTNVDQTTPQVTTLAVPMPITPSTSAAFLYLISNGGGTFDVTFNFVGTGSYTATLAGPDWYGGVYAGTANVDNGFVNNNLSITEGRVQLGAHAGQLVSSIAFSNRSNLSAGYGILAANFEYPPTPRRVNQIALNYNFNGIVHAGENGVPDAPNGYRSISDRGLDFTLGVPSNPLLLPYHLIDVPGVLDIVHLGNRNTVDNGNHMFDAVANGDNNGIQPTWLANVDQTTPQTTTLAQPILLDNASTARFLFQVSNGGGSFDVTFTFLNASPVVANLSGGDWFGGAFPGTDNVDTGLIGAANLSITERTIDLSGQAGQILTSISFSNRSNLVAGYAILAANVSGCIACVNGPNAVVTDLGGSNGPVMSTTSLGNLGVAIDYNITSAAPGGLLAFVALDLGQTSFPLSLVFPGCGGTVHLQRPSAVLVPVDANGNASFVIPPLTTTAICGLRVTSQFGQFVNAACAMNISNALAITIGN